MFGALTAEVTDETQREHGAFLTSVLQDQKLPLQCNPLNLPIFTSMENFTASWTSAWHALDQKLRVGAAGKFLFAKDPGYSFFNGLRSFSDTLPAYARILSIRHDLLGDVEEVDTVGLCYYIWLNSTDLVQVEAEERPGFIERSTIENVPSLDPLEFIVELEPALPSQVGELEMIAVMLNDDTDFFKWWDVPLEEAHDNEAMLNALVHYIRILLKDPSANDKQLQYAFRFIDKMYGWGNPYIATMFDENLMLALITVNDAGVYAEKYFTAEARKNYNLFKKRKQLKDAF